jgi:hypothetical protein
MAQPLDVSTSARQQRIVQSTLHRLTRRPTWLMDALDVARLHTALERHVTEFRSGALRLVEIATPRLFLKDASGIWRGVYELTVEDPANDERRDMPIRVTLAAPGRIWPAGWEPSSVPFGTEGWRCELPELRMRCETEPPEQALEILPQLTDPEQSRALLEQSIRAGSPAYHDLRIASCQPAILNYKPGSRCTLRYDFSYAPEDSQRSWPVAAIAKNYRASKGEQAYHGMVALWNSPLSRSTTVHISQPLAYVPEWKLLVQSPLAEEQTLEELLRATLRGGDQAAMQRLEAFVRAAAAGLAELHLSGARAQKQITWEDRVTTIPEALERVEAVSPDLAEALWPLFERLGAAAAATPADPFVPSHGSFDSDQVLIAGDEIGFIDFDSFCMAEPAVDVGHFRAAIMDSGMKLIDKATLRDPRACQAYLDRLNALGDLFLAEYEAHAPLSRARLDLWEAWDYFRDSLHLWTKPHPRDGEPVVRILEYHLERIGWA